MANVPSSVGVFWSYAYIIWKVSGCSNHGPTDFWCCASLLFLNTTFCYGIVTCWLKCDVEGCGNASWVRRTSIHIVYWNIVFASFNFSFPVAVEKKTFCCYGRHTNNMILNKISHLNDLNGFQMCVYIAHFDDSNVQFMHWTYRLLVC